MTEIKIIDIEWKECPNKATKLEFDKGFPLFSKYAIIKTEIPNGYNPMLPCKSNPQIIGEGFVSGILFYVNQVGYHMSYGYILFESQEIELIKTSENIKLFLVN